jgi:hypothetical protein
MVMALFLALSIPAGAASWEEKVTGGASYTAPYGEFTVTLSAQGSQSDGYKGEGQYYYPPLNRSFHLNVEDACIDPVAGTATAWGPVKGQDGTADGYGFLSVQDNDDAADRFRAGYVAGGTQAADLQGFIDQQCTGAAIFPAVVLDGNFSVRSK